jgi:hypothetical protein
MQVVRAEKGEDFWQRLDQQETSEGPTGQVAEAAGRIWWAIERKRKHAHRDTVLLVNAIRTPWFAQSPIVNAFRSLHGRDAARIGFKGLWIVGASEVFVQRLDDCSGPLHD